MNIIAIIFNEGEIINYVKTFWKKILGRGSFAIQTPTSVVPTAPPLYLYELQSSASMPPLNLIDFFFQSLRPRIIVIDPFYITPIQFTQNKN